MKIPDILDLRDGLKGESLGIKQIRVISKVLTLKTARFHQLSRIYADINNARAGIRSLVESEHLIEENGVFRPHDNLLFLFGIVPDDFFNGVRK